MAVYAIGDVQGCYDELQALLARIGYRPQRDVLWFAGDLVNRGPKSLETLRFVRDLGERAVTVLGNHDLHLIAIASGHKLDKKGHTLDAILDAPDRDELIDWLRSRPLLHHDPDIGFTLVHAGLPPQWDLAQARACAREVEQVLCGKKLQKLVRRLYGNLPDRWSDELAGYDRMRFIINCFTRMRYCDGSGRLDLKSKGAPGSQPQDMMPWFMVPGRLNHDLNIVFGHWSTLGSVQVPGVYPVDTGCLWGGSLTALRLGSKPRSVALPCAGRRRHG